MNENKELREFVLEPKDKKEKGVDDGLVEFRMVPLGKGKPKLNTCTVYGLNLVTRINYKLAMVIGLALYAVVMSCTDMTTFQLVDYIYHGIFHGGKPEVYEYGNYTNYSTYM